MRPHNGESQNLRLYIDQMLQSGREQTEKNSNGEKKEKNLAITPNPVQGNLKTSYASDR